MHKERLLKLASHLYNGKLGAKKFDFTTYYKENLCGTSACAIGECPIVFEEWHFDRIDEYTTVPTLKNTFYSSASAACFFFEISAIEHDFLFVPLNSRLKQNATRYEVAAHIRKFVEHGGIYDTKEVQP